MTTLYEKVDDWSRGYLGCLMTWLIVGGAWIIVYLSGWCLYFLLKAVL